VSLWGTEADSYVGGSGDTVRLDAQGITDVVVGGTATITYRVDSDGGIYRIQAHGGSTKLYDWVLPNAQAANYEVRWVTQGNDPNTTPAASGTWIACTSDRDWVNTSTNADDTDTFTLELRHVGGPTLASVTITLNAFGSP